MNTIQSTWNLLDSLTPKVTSSANTSNEFASVLDEQTKTETVEVNNNKSTSKSEVYNQFNSMGNVLNNNVSDETEETIAFKPMEELIAEKQDIVEQLYNHMLTMLQDNLGLTQEELEKKMEELGIGMQEMMQLSSIQQLVLSQYGANELVDALSNEGLASALQSVTTDFEELMSDSNIEELIGQLGQIENEGSDEITAEEAKPVDADTVPNQEAQAIEDITVSVFKEDNNMNQEQQDSKEHSYDAKEGSVEYMIQQFEATTVNNQVTTEKTVSVREIVSQIVENIHVNISKEMTSMNIHLNPEHLGSVQVEVSSKSGVLTAQLTVQSHATKEAIESSMEALKVSFENQGLKVEEVEVVIGEYSRNPEGESSQENQQGQANKKQKTIEEIDAIMSKEEEFTVETRESSTASIIANGMDISA